MRPISRCAIRRTLLLGLLSLAALGLIDRVHSQQPSSEVPFAKRKITLSGVEGQPVAFPSGDPRTFDAIIGEMEFPKREIDGQLFLPSGQDRPPTIIFVPPRDGIIEPLLRITERLLGAGFGVFLLDPYGARGLNTIQEKTALPLASVTYDTLRAAKHVATLANVDARRIGALGNSFGASAVAHAASAPLRSAALDDGAVPFRAVLAAFPWCGYQFEEPETAPIKIKFLLAGADNWVSVAQCQAYAQAMRFRNPEVRVTIVEGAAHGFASGSEVRDIPEASNILTAPIIYLNKNGHYLNWYTGEYAPGSKFNFQEMVRPFLKKGVSDGSRAGDVERYATEVIGFFREHLGQF